MQTDPFINFPSSAIRATTCVAGDVLFHQDEPTSGLYRVISGCVTLQRTTQAGHQLTLHRATSGTLFAEASVFSDTYHCNAICTLGGQVQHIAKECVLDQLSNDPAFATSFSSLLASQVQNYRFLLEITAIKSATDRVIAAVAAGYLDGPVTEFASRIHLSQEVCYRSLRHLCNQGRLRQVARGRYQLPDGTNDP